MKIFIYICLLLLFSFHGFTQNEYDSVLAKKLGGDDYGMKNFVVAFLYTGPAKIKDSIYRQKIQVAHLRNIQRLAEEGKMIVAGPFLDHSSLRGLFIFNVTTLEEARKLSLTDPAIKAGLLKMVLHQWYGSAALLQVVATHKQIVRKTFVP